ncbi:holo-ACP synthase [Streptomyces rubradiris]|uniref:Holo-[acyl-carrier-protein] synthase n=1 Tax=Streptomyces rubradiris TaxID=285531 RepID=A0ABQ3R9P5_STRRR|nr:holo-ACP synthase [Streptomyces rubradiris]GHH00339.1 holo-[acyl-carrier-protein] synthase [Streptomyces rubradiris]GHI52570.1 holo-[acyl-carrier-protein] synthase [Streptomyces rubradiris]
MPPSDLLPGPGAGGIGEVGIDIVLTARVRAMLAEHGERILARMLTPAELADRPAQDETDPQWIAGRLAAKEAAFKALATSGTALPWLDLEVRSAPGGRPVLRLGPAARAVADRAGVGSVRISISHDGEYAVALAVAVAHPDSPTQEELPHARFGTAGQGLDPQASPSA